MLGNTQHQDVEEQQTQDKHRYSNQWKSWSSMRLQIKPSSLSGSKNSAAANEHKSFSFASDKQ